MTPLHGLLAAVFLVTPSHALEGDAAIEFAWGRAMAAYVRAAPLDDVLPRRDRETALALGVSAAAPAPTRARAVRLRELIEQAEMLRAGRDPSKAVSLFEEAVLLVADGYSIQNAGQRREIVERYKALRFTPGARTTDATRALERAAGVRALARSNLDPAARAQIAGSMERLRAGLGSTKTDDLPGATTAGTFPGASALTVAQAAETYRQSGRVLPAGVTRAGVVPDITLSQSIAYRAQEVQARIDAVGDDGTVNGAIGQALHKGEVLINQFGSWVTSGETWRRAWDAKGSLLEVQYAPGAVVALGRHVVHDLFVTNGEKIGTATGELVMKPTPYNAASLIGVVGMTGVDFFTGGARKAAVGEILEQGAKQTAEVVARETAGRTARSSAETIALAVDTRWRELTKNGVPDAAGLDAFLKANNIAPDSPMAAALREKLPKVQAATPEAVAAHVKAATDHIHSQGVFRVTKPDVEDYLKAKNIPLDSPLGRAVLEHHGFGDEAALLAQLSDSGPRTRVRQPVSGPLGAERANLQARLRERGYSGDAVEVLEKLPPDAARRLTELSAAGPAGKPQLDALLKRYMDLGPNPERVMSYRGEKVVASGSPRSSYSRTAEHGPEVRYDAPLYRGMSVAEFEKWRARRGFPNDEGVTGNMPMKYASYDVSGAQKYAQQGVKPGQPMVVVEFTGSDVAMRTGGAATEREFLLLGVKEFKVVSVHGVESSVVLR